MRNAKAIAATGRVELFNTLFENPEITAMAAICEILRDLPDDAARLRVMRWSFGRFSPEFKLPLPDLQPEAVHAHHTAHAEPAVRERVAAVRAESEADTADFARQISELNDFFAPA